MRQTTIILTVTIASFFSCTDSKKWESEYVLFNAKATEGLVEDFQDMNHETINFLDSIGSNKKLSIGFVRNESIQKIEDLKNELIEYCGGRNKMTNELLNPIERNKVAYFFIDKNKGKELKEAVNMIIDFINEHGATRNYLARDMSEYPELIGIPSLDQKTFSELYFSNTTLIGALNTIAILEAVIVQVESEFLNNLLKKEILNSM